MEHGDILNNLCDLHMHLGSAATAHTLWELAHDRGIALKEKDYWRFVEAIEWVELNTYERYLARFDYTERIQSSPDAVERCVYEAFSLSYRKSNVRLLELRFNPVLRNSNGFYDLDKIIFSAIVGMKKSQMIYPIEGGLILCMDRRLAPELNLIIAEKAAKFSKEGVVGVDLAGPMHPNFTWDQMIAPTQVAKNAGLGVTIHTGEITPADEVWEVLNKLSPHRIGHGVKSYTDEALLKEISKRQVLMEICPSSNLRTKDCVRDWAEMRTIFDRFKQHQINYAICSDNPVFLGTNVLKENTELLDKGILSAEDVQKATQNSRLNSFIYRRQTGSLVASTSQTSQIAATKSP